MDGIVEEELQHSLVECLDQQCHRGCRAHGIRYRKLSPVRPLEWEDLDNYLEDLPERPPSHIRRELRATFEDLRDDPSLEFRKILELLARVLG